MIPNTLLVTGLGPDNNLVKLSPEELHCKTLLFESKHATPPEHVSRCRYHLNASEPPINARLPPELLSAIFMEYMLMCTAYVDNPGYKDVYFDNQPCLWFTVASVCRYWRDITFSTPNLFSRVDLVHQHEESIPFWLTYSAQVPLQVTCELVDSSPNGEIIHKQWNTIERHARRIVSLKVHTEVWSYMPLEWASGMPWIKELSIIPSGVEAEGFDEENDSQTNTVWKVLGCCSNVTKLFIGLKLAGTSWTSHMSHHSLTKLVLSDWEMESWAAKDEDIHSGMLATFIQNLPLLDDLELIRLSFPSHRSLKEVCSHRLTQMAPSHPLSHLRATGSLAAVMSILASGLLGPCKIDISGWQTRPLNDGDIELITDILTSLPVPWGSIMSMKTRNKGDRKHQLCSWRGWSYFVPPRLRDYTEHNMNPLSIFQFSISINTDGFGKMDKPIDFGAKLTLGLSRACPAIESTSVILAHGKPQAWSPDIRSIICCLSDTLVNIRDLRIPACTQTTFQAFLKRLGEKLPHLCSLHILFNTMSPGITIQTLESIRNSLVIREANGSVRLDELILRRPTEDDPLPRGQALSDLQEEAKRLYDLVREVKISDASVCVRLPK